MDGVDDDELCIRFQHHVGDDEADVGQIANLLARRLLAEVDWEYVEIVGQDFLPDPLLCNEVLHACEQVRLVELGIPEVVEHQGEVARTCHAEDIHRYGRCSKVDGVARTRRRRWEWASEIDLSADNSRGVVERRDVLLHVDHLFLLACELELLLGKLELLLDLGDLLGSCERHEWTWRVWSLATCSGLVWSLPKLIRFGPPETVSA